MRRVLYFLFFMGLGYANPSPASFEEPKRLLLLDGDSGSVACRVYGSLMSGTIPRFSDNWTLESATRSLLRMKNLTAVRGPAGASMVGPADYLGNLENPDQYFYTIRNGFPPLFYRDVDTDTQEPPLHPFDDRLITFVKAHWVSGSDAEISERQKEYHIVPKDLRHSLFPNPGLLEMDQEIVELSPFDPRDIDLSAFKARLVNNSVPFRITKKPLPSKDEYRLVTYLYEPLYAQWQIHHGSGLFLEEHDFAQTITPITPQSKGFVTLAKKTANPDELGLIAIEIPYGYTLIIEDECIHGDTTLNGLFMMGMTSDHITMATADTVFLKCSVTKKNVTLKLVGDQPLHIPNDIPAVYVIYDDATNEGLSRFQAMTQGQSFIFNPFSRAYFQ